MHVQEPVQPHPRSKDLVCITLAPITITPGHYDQGCSATTFGIWHIKSLQPAHQLQKYSPPSSEKAFTAVCKSILRCSSQHKPPPSKVGCTMANGDIRYSLRPRPQDCSTTLASNSFLKWPSEGLCALVPQISLATNFKSRSGKLI